MVIMFGGIGNKIKIYYKREVGYGIMEQPPRGDAGYGLHRLIYLFNLTDVPMG